MAAGTEIHSETKHRDTSDKEAATCQVKSKERVAKHAEVFTAKREVNAMLDLVKHETERLDSRFLEPACGTGNFLEAILLRKLAVAERDATPTGRKKPLPEKFERNSIVALTSIYGVELLDDNVKECRERLYGIWLASYSRVCRKAPSEMICECARFILERNIICGNALSMKKVDAGQNDTTEPIVFSEWAFIGEYRVKRTDYRLDKMLEGGYGAAQRAEAKPQKTELTQGDLFGEDAAAKDGEGDIIAKFPPLPHYARIAEYGE